MTHLRHTATALLLAAAAPAQLLLTNDTVTDTCVAFNPFDGSVISNGLFSIPNSVQVAAIDVNGEIWISEQTGDRITRRDLAGNVIATIGPTFVGGGLDNIRGMAFVNGQIYVTNAGTANGAPGNAIVVFDPAGNFVTSFTTNLLATSPFAVIPFQGDILVSGFNNNNDIYRFTLAGAPVGMFHNSTTVSPAHGLALASDGNVWCVGFTSANVAKLDATTGNVISTFPAPNTPRGVHELGNGNVMWTNSQGVNIYDIVTQTSSLVFAGTCNHVGLYNFPVGSASAATYGSGCFGLGIATAGMPQLGNAGFALVVNNVPATSPIGLVGFATTAVNPGVDLTAVGMAGCFGLTTLDVGLFSGSPVVAGRSSVPLAIPNVPALAGSTFAAQGVAFSALTALGLSSSNGLSFTLGN